MNTGSPAPIEPEDRRPLTLVALTPRVSSYNCLHDQNIRPAPDRKALLNVTFRHTSGRSRPRAPYDASRSRCASGSASSFLSVWFSIWRIRSRVTLNARPTSSSV